MIEQILGSRYKMNSCVKRQLKRHSISHHPCCQASTATTRAFVLEFVLEPSQMADFPPLLTSVRASTAEGNKFDTLADVCSTHSDNRSACITYPAMCTHEWAPCVAAPFQKATVVIHLGALLLPTQHSPPLLYATDNENEVMGMLAFIVTDVRGYKLEP